MADDLMGVTPLYPDDDEDAILVRMRAWANEGLDPAADPESWVDTREGGHWHICVMQPVREIARLYDFAGTEVVAAATPVGAWADYLDRHAEVQQIARLAATPAEGVVTFTGDPGTPIPAGTVVGVVPVLPDDDAPEYLTVQSAVIDGDGSVDVIVRAATAGVAGDVAAAAIVEVSGIPGVDVVNADPMHGGSETEDDESLRGRVLAAFSPQGAGNRVDYERWASAWAGVGRVTIIPLWNGPTTVKVIVTDANGQPLPASVVNGLQADLDPVPGKGEKRAPIGAVVTVVTAVALEIDISATIEPEPGYSLDGDGGTIALRPDLAVAVREYVERVLSGSEIVFAKVEGVMATLTGVHDLSDVQINGQFENVAVLATPAEAPQLQSLTLQAA